MNNTHALPPTPADPSGWRENAACRAQDPGLFFPDGMAGPTLGQVRAAKLVCRACPVRIQCLDFATRTGVVSGIWGGTTEQERRIMRRAARL